MNLKTKAPALFLFIFLSLSSYAQITSTFTTDDEGWTNSLDLVGSGAVTTVYSATGGNPGGYISSTFASPGPAYWYWLAPAKFLGDRCVSSYNQNFKFDLKESGTPNDVNYSDVILWNPSNNRVYYQLPTQPGATWTPYSVLLNETAGWHYNSATGPAPTKDEMIAILSNLSAIQIRSRHSTPTGITSSIDNVVLEIMPAGPAAPAITSITPTSGIPGILVTIKGSNFNSTKLNNLVYFNGVKATIQSASATQLTVIVPAGAMYGRLSVIDLSTSLTAQSLQNFNPTFDNNKDFGGQIIPSSMDIKYDISLDASTTKAFTNAGDLDGDGRNDLLVVENLFKKVSIFRNKGFTGDINASSFETKVSLDIGYTSKGENIIADLDNDGKPDIVVGTASASSALLAIFHNTSTAGSLSFDAVKYVTASSYSDGSLHAADIDGDGRLDILSAFNNSCGGAGAYFSIFPNMSTPGNIEFCAYRDFDFATLCQSNAISTGDLDGDGKLDIAVVSSSDSEFYIFQNTSTPGAFSLATPFVIDSPGSSFNVVMADFDADNKLDLAWKSDGVNDIVLKKNVHTAGALSAASFSADINLQTPLGGYGRITTADINGDGKPDLIANDDNNLGIIQNISTTGVLTASSFTSGVIYQGYVFSQFPTAPIAADFDGDNKPDVVFGTTNVSPAFVSIYRNECFPAPRIDSFAPTTANINSSLSLTGDYFFTNNDAPILRLGNFNIPATAPSNTSLSTAVPVGVISDRLTVTNHGLTGFSAKPLTITFPTSRVIDATSFDTPIEFAMTAATDGLTVADFDNDGKSDVVVEDNGNVRIFSNTLASSGASIGATTLTAIETTYTQATHVNAADVDGDGKTDLVVNSFLHRNNSGATADAISFEANVNSLVNGNRIAVSHDFNHDGKSDFAVTTNGNTYGVYENASRKGTFTSTGGGAFSTITNPGIGTGAGGQVSGITAGDFDGDGYSDFAYGANNTADILAVIRNTGLNEPLAPAQFETAVTFPALDMPFSIASADFDNDGKLDIVLGNNNAAFISIYRNTSTTGSLSFLPKQDIDALTKAIDIEAVDLDGDGKAEIIVAHQPTTTTGSFTIFQNTSTSGTISFAPGINYTLLRGPISLSVADLNLDSKPDLIFTTKGATDALLVFENKITVPKLLTVVTPVASVATCINGKANLSVTASGTTNITYQWQKFNSGKNAFENISSGNGFEGINSSTLTITINDISAEGGYRCVVSGDLSIDGYSDTISLVITSGIIPIITMNGNTLKSSEGEFYQWYSSNTPIANATTSTLEINIYEYGVYAVDVTTNGCVGRSADFTYLITGFENHTDQVKIYPNPVNDKLIIETPTAILYKLTLIDLLGKEIKISATEEGLKKIAYIDSLNSGYYTLILQSDQSKRHYKILKQ